MGIYYLITFVAYIVVNFKRVSLTQCGCKSLRPCYESMINTLLDSRETICVEDSEASVNNMFIFLRALKQFCGNVVTVLSDHETSESRVLYEVVVHNQSRTDTSLSKPVIVIDAAQQAGEDSLGLALYFIEQLVACNEYDDMINKVMWVFMPCVNPDGLEYNSFSPGVFWKKNLKMSKDNSSVGVDISRNFDSHFTSCPKVHPFSPNYPGEDAASEEETIFVKNVLDKHKQQAKVYISIRRDGHGIYYPYAYAKGTSSENSTTVRVAADIASKVNQRAGHVQYFDNDTIFDLNGVAHCGHSVDYAYDLGIPLTYELRVFGGHDLRLVKMFHGLPRNYDASLRTGYFNGIREIYTYVTTHDVPSGKDRC